MAFSTFDTFSLTLSLSFARSPCGLDLLDPSLTLGGRLRPQLVLPLVLPTVHYREAVLKGKGRGLAIQVIVSYRGLLITWVHFLVLIGTSQIQIGLLNDIDRTH